MKRKVINTSKAARTGNKPTLTVAIEQHFPESERIINDSMAPLLFSGMNRFWIWATKCSLIRNAIVNFTEKFMSGGWSCFLVRKRYIDEKLLEIISKYKIKSIVNLGAGFDTRLYRFPEVQDIKSWEVDQLKNVKAKQKAIEKALGKFPDHVQQVDVNFVEQDIAERLKENNYKVEEPTFFIWEAVSQYVNEAAIEKMFMFFSKAPKGSYLVFTYVPKDFINGTNLYGQELLYKKLIKGNIWHFGFDPKEMNSELSKYSWKLIEDLGYDELGERYVKPSGRKLGVMEVERIAFAAKL